MTRRAFARAGKVLSLNEYIHRATLGLPKTERLDAAAELRTHLLEQVAVLEAKGFAREEAEFLAVQAMGAVRLGTRSLLGRTRILGWTVLGLMSLATGSWWVYNNLMPPREGIEITDSNLTPDDIAGLWYSPDAPRGYNANYNGAVLTYPKATRTVYYAYITPNKVVINSNALSVVNDYDVAGRWPGSYRYQERWLLLSQEDSKTCPQDLNLFVSVRAVQSPLSYTDSPAGYPPDLDTKKAGFGSWICAGMKHLPITAASSSESRVTMDGVLPPIENGTLYKPLPLGRWTILHELMTISKGQWLRDLPPNYNNSVYLAVLPSDQAASVSDSGAVFKRDDKGNITNLTYGGQRLPDPPATDWAAFKRNISVMP